MIYISHPAFKFEGASGGHVIGCVNNCNVFNTMVYVDHPFQYEKFNLLNPDRIYSKFEKAKNPYENPYDIAFSFLREDGAEFAIRFLNNINIDIIGYWIVEEEEPGTRYPRSYYDFLEWLGDSLI